MQSRLVARVALLAAALALANHADARAGWWPWDTSSTIHLDVADGTLDVTLQPDRGRSLALTADGTNRWSFEGNTSSLVGQPYSIELENHTSERLKVVVSVDGLNVYGREVVAGNSGSDVGSILSPWGDRTLTGWQLDDRRAQRFVFSPPEWSEGAGRTDARIGVVVVQVYRERRYYALDRDRDEEMQRAPAGAAPESVPAPKESRADGAEAPAPPAARRAPIGTTSGEDVESDVRTVYFEPATYRPEAWARIDYGQTRHASQPRPVPREDYGALGMRLGSDADGTRILYVAPGSAADRAGLEADDVIVRIDTTYEPSLATTRRILDAKDRGEYAFFRVRRGSNELAVKIRT
jgi:hypothetical protein